MAEVKVGDSVLYVPCVATHWSDRDFAGRLVFEFVATKDARGVRAGEVVPIRAAPPDMGRDCPHGFTRGADGELHTWDGYTVKPGKCKKPWPAKVVAIHEDGTADLDVTDASGAAVHHKMRVKQSDDKTTSNTWHISPISPGVGGES